MAFVFELPEIGEGVVEGEIVSWKVTVGQAVKRDEPFCEIMTDKATVEISSPVSGVVVELFGEPGDIVQVHAPLANIDESGQAAAAPAPKATPAPSESAPALTPAPAPAPPPKAAASAAPAAPASSSRRRGSAPSDPASREHTRATPAVRRDARERGIDIDGVAGTGPGGRVTRDDLSRHEAPASSASDAPLAKAPPALPQVFPSGHVETVKIIGLRRKIAQQMLAATLTAPHFTYVEEIDVTELVAVRKRLKGKAADRGIKLTYLPFIMKACSVAFREFPNVNATMNTENYELTVHGDHNIGIATDTPQGLFVPVVRNVEQKSILHLAADIAEVTGRTRAGKATSEDFSGGTFTITSVGNIGGVLATPILNMPEVAILGVNAIRDRAVVRDGEIVVRKMVNFSPSFDHRIIDGAVAARFVARVKALLEDPAELLMELS